MCLTCKIFNYYVTKNKQKTHVRSISLLPWKFPSPFCRHQPPLKRLLGWSCSSSCPLDGRWTTQCAAGPHLRAFKSPGFVVFFGGFILLRTSWCVFLLSLMIDVDVCWVVWMFGHWICSSLGFLKRKGLEPRGLMLYLLEGKSISQNLSKWTRERGSAGEDFEREWRIHVHNGCSLAALLNLVKNISQPVFLYFRTWRS